MLANIKKSYATANPYILCALSFSAPKTST
jgi:hypothetical protein